MRPIKLIMNAFGPYKDRVDIDFEKFDNQDIFLITGDTGSGKTTIFDAVVFALFGEASGSRRNSSSFRSDFADNEVDTYVKLDFIHKGIIYKIERFPSYMRKKKRGDGFTKSNGDASLVYLDNVITGDVNVSNECARILGMNANQFKQIVMIAQGEFLDLLFAKPKDRAVIFRRIFDTGIYKNISDVLRNRYLDKKREYEDSFLTINSYIQGIDIDMDIQDKSTEEVLVLLREEIAKDKEEELKIEKEKELLLDKSSNIVKTISSAKIINNSIIELDKYKLRLEELLKIKEEINNKEKIISINNDIWNKIIPKYKDYINKRQELADKKIRLDSAFLDKEDVLKEYEKIELKYKEIDKKQELISSNNQKQQLINNKILILNDINEIKNRLQELKNIRILFEIKEKEDILQKIKSCKIKSQELDRLRQNIDRDKEEYLDDNKVYLEHYDLFLSTQAGIFASNLKNGQPCPVCGSTDHPCLAKKVEDVLTKEELDLEKERLDSKYKSLEELRLDLVFKEQVYNTLHSEVKHLLESDIEEELNLLRVQCLNRNMEIDNFDKEELEKDIKVLEVELLNKGKGIDNEENIEALEKEKNTLISDNSNIKKEIDLVINDYNKVFEKKTQVVSLIKVLEDQINELNKKESLSNKEYIDSYMSLGYKNEAKYIALKKEQEELNLIENDVNEYYQQKLEVESNISSLEKIIDNRKFMELESLEHDLKILNEKINGLDVSLKNISNRLSNNSNIFNKLNTVSQNATKLEREVMIYKDLADTANGSIAGKNKLEFEQYIQAGYFDMILVSANKRFEYMTQERYRLVRKEEATKVSDKLGLELEVMDYYTGKRRDIRSLSGGESFKAALSLALGMSDTIQEFSGGVVVDAMFIDEGFGSLDDESLDQAMNAIMMLSKNNKLIGIISHVNELKTRIDKKIIIKKSNNGSNISLVV